jgi:uncharacterized protein YeaO (DUF488 family)
LFVGTAWIRKPFGRYLRIKLKRIYEKSNEADGLRVLIDRLWPRGVSKEEAKIDVWLKDLAPSTELRKWYGHEHKKWDAFKKRYADELASKAKQVEEFLDSIKLETITLVFSSKEEELNNATFFKEYLEKLTR